MGCVCCSLSSFISIVLNALERISACTVCAMLVCCIMLTLLGVLITGVGIGYHYCTVQTKAIELEKLYGPSSYVEARRSAGADQLTSVNKVVKDGFVHHVNRRETDDDKIKPKKTNNVTVHEMFVKVNHTIYNGTRTTFKGLVS